MNLQRKASLKMWKTELLLNKELTEELFRIIVNIKNRTYTNQESLERIVEVFKKAFDSLFINEPVKPEEKCSCSKDDGCSNCGENSNLQKEKNVMLKSGIFNDKKMFNGLGLTLNEIFTIYNEILNCTKSSEVQHKIDKSCKFIMKSITNQLNKKDENKDGNVDHLTAYIPPFDSKIIEEIRKEKTDKEQIKNSQEKEIKICHCSENEKCEACNNILNDHDEEKIAFYMAKSFLPYDVVKQCLNFLPEIEDFKEFPQPSESEKHPFNVSCLESMKNINKEQIKKSSNDMKIKNSQGKDISMYNTGLSAKRENWAAFAKLIANQFEHGGEKYALINDMEHTDFVCLLSPGKTGVDWIIQTIVKYCGRFLNQKREKDLLKIATYCFLAWIKCGFHLNQDHDEDVKKSNN